MRVDFSEGQFLTSFIHFIIMHLLALLAHHRSSGSHHLSLSERLLLLISLVYLHLLCFIISYDHILNKEELWREWIEPNKDIINVYFYYKELQKIKDWRDCG